jgi:hypothetical protein
MQIQFFQFRAPEPSVGMTPEKERMKERCASVYKWVKSMKK